MSTSSTHTQQKPQQQTGAQSAEQTNLNFGSIGIEAVAAAARYCGERSTPSQQMTFARIDQRFVETAG